MRRAERALMIALMSGTALATAQGGAARAQPPAPEAARSAEIAFDIPAGDLATVLNRYAEQAGVQLLFPYEAAVRARSGGLNGRYGRDRALAILLQGSPLRIARDDGRTIALREAAFVETASAEPPEVEEVVVVGQRAALNRALEAERRADPLVSVVAAEDIGQFADQNVAESLQRVPGVTVGRSEGEGRSVSVRGLPSQFTPVTINGVRLGTSNLDSAAVALDSISNDQLERLSVTKTALPSQDADTLGGLIDLKTLSAFTRRSEEVQLRAEGYYGEEVGDWGEELAANITRRLLGGAFGAAGTLSYSRRPIRGEEIEAEDGIDAVAALDEDGPEFLRPDEVEIVNETGERTRWNASLNLEYRPDATAELHLRGTFSQLNDEDLSFQDVWEVEESEDEDILEVRPGGGRFDDVRLGKRLFFQDITDRVFSLSGGGGFAAASWEVDWRLDYARSEFDNPEALRGRFRQGDLLMELDTRQDGLTIVPGVGGDGGDPEDPSEYDFNQLLYVQEFREDQVGTAAVDVARDLDAFGRPATFSFGVKGRLREKTNDRQEYTGDPDDVGVEETLEGLPLFDEPTEAGYPSVFPEAGATLDLFRRARDTLLAENPAYQRRDLSSAGDYVIEEDVSAAYVQGVFEPTETLRVIAGLRVEHTEAAARGFYTEFDSSGRGPDGEPGVIAALPEASSEYAEWFPGLHLRWTPREDTVVRASYARGIQRPDFTDRRNSARAVFDADDPTDRDLNAGNPNLEPLTADQFDVSVAWYPAREAVVQASAFYKRIDSFFADLSADGEDLASLPVVLPAGVSTEFDRVNTVVNGEEATVWGLELGYTQSFTALPGLLSGLFVQANATLVDSQAEVLARPGETFTLPGQRDVVGNLSVGWEDERLTLRLAANHRGESLVQLGGDPEEDVFAEPTTQLDFNLRYNATDQVQVYLDAVNLTEAGDVRFWRGDDFGPLLYSASGFGRTYQIGLRARF